jgi:hypothetical protein
MKMNRIKEVYPTGIKINGDLVVVYLSFNDVVELVCGMNDKTYITLVQESLERYSHLVHKEIAKTMDLNEPDNT